MSKIIHNPATWHSCRSCFTILITTPPTNARRLVATCSAENGQNSPIFDMGSALGVFVISETNNYSNQYFCFECSCSTIIQ